MLNLLSEIFTINTATLSGCIDIIVIKQADGTLASSPFHLRFGKLKVLKSSDKILSVQVNGKDVDLIMKLGSAGEGFFVHETAVIIIKFVKIVLIDLQEEVFDNEYRASPLMSSGEVSPRNYSSSDETEEKQNIDATDIQAVVNDLQKIQDSQQDSTLTNDPKNEVSLDNKSAASTQQTMIEDDEEEKIDLRLLQQSPKAIRRSIEEQFKQEIEKEIASSKNNNDKKEERISRWRWLWGEQPEQNMNSSNKIKEIKVEKSPQAQLEQDKSPQRLEQSQQLSEKQTIEGQIKPDLTKNDLEKNKVQPISNNGQKIVESSQHEQQTETEKKGFLRRMFGYFKKSPSENTILIDTASQSNQNSNNQGNSQNNLTNEDEDEATEINLSLCAHMIMPIGGQQKSDEEIIQAFEENKINYDQFCASPHLLLMDSRLVIRIEDQYFNWATAAPFIISMLAFKQPLSNEIIGEPLVVLKSSQYESQEITEDQNENYSSNNQVSQPEHHVITNSNDLPKKNFQDDSPIQTASNKKTKIYYKKSLIPTSEQLQSMELHEGVNDIVFTVTTSLLGKQQLQSRIFVWDCRDKIVISDVDGTITKSDMLGHVLPRFGKDWTHQGIAKLYTGIEKNGYKILYLSSRPIGLADFTREYLKGIKQDEKFGMPEGPVIMSPDRMVKSMNREIIQKKPQMFKIAALKNIYNLFPEDSHPFVGGFGNRDTDAISYRAVGVSLDKIFIVNDDGEIFLFNSQHKKSYNLLADVVDDMYPCLIETAKQSHNLIQFNLIYRQITNTIKDSVQILAQEIENELNQSKDEYKPDPVLKISSDTNPIPPEEIEALLQGQHQEDTKNIEENDLEVKDQEFI
ncbi:phosphatidate phosphatase lpin3 [Stylonychia lemnae]|uniref:phosphatidate phosphatase n=1 Tax=Stylonychia lemnae TaxID=5949 RepID=A0A078B7L2_STYLE|nr:phosphatidate phosphatase lpin3 [Stylonychia lemnae]|eukprot:CDW90374.1 phosphatidate phosphatase lpin3 [Stylonychia lemnae]